RGLRRSASPSGTRSGRVLQVAGEGRADRLELRRFDESLADVPGLVEELDVRAGGQLPLADGKLEHAPERSELAVDAGAREPARAALVSVRLDPVCGHVERAILAEGPDTSLPDSTAPIDARREPRGSSARALRVGDLREASDPARAMLCAQNATGE